MIDGAALHVAKYDHDTVQLSQHPNCESQVPENRWRSSIYSINVQGCVGTILLGTLSVQRERGEKHSPPRVDMIIKRKSSEIYVNETELDHIGARAESLGITRDDV